MAHSRLDLAGAPRGGNHCQPSVDSCIPGCRRQTCVYVKYGNDFPLFVLCLSWAGAAGPFSLLLLRGLNFGVVRGLEEDSWQWGSGWSP